MSSDFGAWHKSSYSANPRQECVEVRETPRQVFLRDTQHRDLGHLTLPAREWAGFLSDIKSGGLR